MRHRRRRLRRQRERPRVMVGMDLAYGYEDAMIHVVALQMAQVYDRVAEMANAFSLGGVQPRYLLAMKTTMQPSAFDRIKNIMQEQLAASRPRAPFHEVLVDHLHEWCQTNGHTMGGDQTVETTPIHRLGDITPIERVPTRVVRELWVRFHGEVKVELDPYTGRPTSDGKGAFHNQRWTDKTHDALAALVEEVGRLRKLDESLRALDDGPRRIPMVNLDPNAP